MPNTKSAKKALRQSLRRQNRNKERKNKYKTAIKALKKAVSSKSVEQAKQLLPKVYKALDKAAKANTIKKNKASRLKSRLGKLFNTIQANKVKNE